jgi:hypothetical protein
MAISSDNNKYNNNNINIFKTCYCICGPGGFENQFKICQGTNKQFDSCWGQTIQFLFPMHIAYLKLVFKSNRTTNTMVWYVFNTVINQNLFIFGVDLLCKFIICTIIQYRNLIYHWHILQTILQILNIILDLSWVQSFKKYLQCASTFAKDMHSTQMFLYLPWHFIMT